MVPESSITELRNGYVSPEAILAWNAELGLEHVPICRPYSQSSSSLAFGSIDRIGTLALELVDRLGVPLDDLERLLLRRCSATSELDWMRSSTSAQTSRLPFYFFGALFLYI